MKLDDFLKCKKVRCVEVDDDFLTVGKEYDVLDRCIEIKITDDEGFSFWFDSDYFEPVLVDNSEVKTQDNSVNIQDTPKFKVGDKVYFDLSGRIAVINKLDGSNDFSINNSGISEGLMKSVCLATPENYALLSKLYPHIEFEQPPKELKGSDLCRAMLEKGWKYVLCWVSNYGEDMRGAIDFVYSRNHSGQFKAGGGNFNHAVPFDPRTGEPLTEAVLDESKNRQN